MEQPPNGPGSPGVPATPANPPPTPPAPSPQQPGTIIKPHTTGPLPAAPAKAAEMQNHEAATVTPPPNASIPVAPTPPLANSVVAMKPVEEKPVVSPHIEARPEGKVITPITLQKQVEVAKPPPETPAISDNVPSFQHKTANIYKRVPITLLVAISIILATSIFALTKPTKTPSASITQGLQILAGLNILLSVGLYLRYNWARSLYVTLNIAAIVIQIFAIYQIRTTASQPPSINLSKNARSVAIVKKETKDWLDPTYGQANQRIIVFLGEMVGIYLLTTPFMNKVFEQRNYS